MNPSREFHPDFLGEMCRRLSLKRYPSTRQFVVQHLFPDTVRLLKLLHEHVAIDTVIGISYSGDAASVDALRALGMRVLTPSYAALAEVVAVELADAVERCRRAEQRLLIHEVGGFAIRALHEPEYIGGGTVVGALEVTKQGVWVAEQLKELRIPQLNIAQTRLKRVEGKLVGEAVVAALDTILREMGYATVGRDALVCGYGWVGQGVAHSLKNRGMGVSVRDIDSVALVEAAVDGFRPMSGMQLPNPVALVVGASGRCSIDSALVDQLPDKCFLVSGASKNHEIDLEFLRRQSADIVELHPYVRQHTLHDGRRMLLVNQGFPVNFTGPSVPDEVVEFLFAQLIQLVPKVLDDTPPAGISTLPADEEALAANIWLELR